MAGYLDIIRSYDDDNDAERCAQELINHFLEIKQGADRKKGHFSSIFESAGATDEFDFISAEKEDLDRIDKILQGNPQNPNLKILLSIREKINEEVPAEVKEEKFEDSKEEKKEIVRKDSSVLKSEEPFSIPRSRTFARLKPLEVSSVPNVEEKGIIKKVNETHKELKSLTYNYLKHLEKEMKNELLKLLNSSDVTDRERSEWILKGKLKEAKWLEGLLFCFDPQNIKRLSNVQNLMIRNNEIVLLHLKYQNTLLLSNTLKPSSVEWMHKKEDIVDFTNKLHQVDGIISHRRETADWRKYVRKCIDKIANVIPAAVKKYLPKFSFVTGEKFTTQAKGKVLDLAVKTAKKSVR